MNEWHLYAKKKPIEAGRHLIKYKQYCNQPHIFTVLIDKNGARYRIKKSGYCMSKYDKMGIEKWLAY